MTSTTRRGRPPRTDEQRAEQRAQLLDAAMKAIRRHGPEASIDDIAADAGVSKPVLYGHFGDKLGLADAISVELAERATAITAAALADDERVDLRVAVVAIVEALVGLVEDEPALYGFLVRTIRSGERGFFDNALVEVIRERAGLLVGLINPGIDLEWSRVLIDGAFGFLLFSVESWQLAGAPPRDQLVQTLADVVVEGFRVAAGPDAATTGDSPTPTER